MAVEVELWMHPACYQSISALRAQPTSTEAEATTRSMGLLDSLVAGLKAGNGIPVTLAALRPRNLAAVECMGSALTTWPATADGRAFQSNCESVTLCLYQMGRVRSVVGILNCGNEIFVVWLSVSLTAATRSDGFESDTDAALAQQSLWGKLGLLLDLTWLESE